MENATALSQEKQLDSRFSDEAIRNSGARGDSFSFACPYCKGTVIGKKSLLSDKIRASCSKCGRSI